MFKYASNVAKSVGFISVNVIKGLNPTLSNYVSDSVSDVKDIYDDLKGKGGGIKEFFSDKTSLIKDGLGNAFEDLKSGNFYNPDRQNGNLSAAFSFDDNEFNDFFSIDDDDDSSSDKESKSDDDNSVAMAAVAGTIANTSKVSTNRLTKTNRQNTQAMMLHNTKMFNTLTKSVMTVNNTMMSMYNDISKPLNAHMQNTYNFQLASIDEMKKQTDYLKTITDLLKNRFEGDGGGKGFGKKDNRSTWQKVMGGGLPNIKELFNVGKSAVNDMGIGMLSMLMDKDLMSNDMLRSTDLFNSPIATLISMFAGSKLKNSGFGKSLDRFVTRLPKLVSGGIARANSWAKNSPGGFLSDIVGFITGKMLPGVSNEKLDVSRYHKGRSEWTGMNDKALREVIPTQLAKILSALTGEEAKIFNYQTGRWEKVSYTIGKHRKDFDNSVTNNISAGRQELDDYIKKTYGTVSSTAKARESLMNDYTNLMRIVAVTPGIDLGNPSELKATLKRLGVLGRSVKGRPEPKIHEENFQIIVKAIQSSTFTTMGISVRDARNQFIANMNDSGDFGTYGQIINGSGLTSNNKKYARNLVDFTDNKGNNLFFYLQNFYSDLKRIAHNIEMGGGGKGRGARFNRAKSGNSLGFDVPDNSRIRKLANATANPYDNTDGRMAYYGFENAENLKATDLEKEKKEKEEKEKKAKEEEKGLKGLFKKFFGGVFGSDSENFNFFDNLGNTLEKLLYGDEGLDSDGNKVGLAGILTNMNKSLEKVLENVQNVAKEFVFNKSKKVLESLRNKVDKFKEENPDFINRFKSSFFDNGIPGAYKRTFNNYAEQSIGVIRSGLRNFAAKVKTPSGEITSGGSYRGGEVQKTGLVAVSEGEVIIPSNKNPNFKKPATQSSQKSKENSVIKNFMSEIKGRMWGAYAEGTDENGVQNPRSVTGKVIKEGAKVAKKAAPHLKREAYNLGQDAKDLAHEAVGLFKDILGGARDRAEAYLDAQFGESEIYQSGKNLIGMGSKKVKKLSKTPLVKELKKFLPETVAGGVTGALIGGAATGSGLGLMGGLALGAGINLVRNSKKISTMLFGKENKTTGKMSGGIINGQISTFIKKQLPKSVGKGILGSIIGATALPGLGLFGGFALGAGLDLLSTTEGFKGLFLGHVGADGKRRGGLQEMFRIRVIDPLTGFVKDQFSKMGDYFKKNFINPLFRLFLPVKDAAIGIFNDVSKFVGGMVRKHVFEPFVQKLDFLFKPFTSVFGKIGKKLLGGFGKLLKFPGKVVGGIGDSIARYNIRHGYSTANAKERVRLSKTGIVNRINKLTGKEYNTSMYDNFAASDEVSSEDLRGFLDLAQSPEDYDETIVKNNQKFSNMVSGSMIHGGLNNKKELKDIAKYLDKAKGDIDVVKEIIPRVNKLVKEGVISKENGEAIIEKARELRENNLKVTKEKQDNIQKRADYVNKYKHLGITEDIFADKNNISNFSRIINADIKYKEKEEEKKKQQEEEKKETIEAAKKLDPLGGEVADNTKNIFEKLKDIFSWLTKKFGPEDSPSNNKLPGIDNGNEASGDAETNSDGTVVKYTENGPVTYVKDDQGNIEPDTKDANTNKALEANEKDRTLRNGFFAAMTSKDFLAGFKSLFSPDEDKDPNRKPNFFEKIFGNIKDTLFGIGSSIMTLVTAVPTILAGMGAINFISSLLDPKGGNILQRIGNGFKNSVKTADGLERAFLGHKDRKYSDKEYKEQYLGTRFAKGLLTQGVIGGRTLSSKHKIINFGLRAGNKIFNAGAKFVGNKAGDAIRNGAEKFIESEAGSKLVTKAMPHIEKAVTGTVKALGKADKLTTAITTKTTSVATRVMEKTPMGKIIKGIKFCIEKASKIFGKEVSEEVIEQGAESIAAGVATKAGANAVAKATIVLAIVQIGLAVENGFEDAQANIGMLTKPTLGERFVSGLAAGISEFLFGILPVPFLCDIIIGIGGIFGLDVSGIRAKQAAVKAELAEWNKTHKDQHYNTVREYLKSQYNLYTTQDKVWRTVKGVVKPVGKVLGAVAKPVGKVLGVAAKGVGLAVKGTGKLVGATVNTGFKSVKFALADPMTKLKMVKETMAEAKAKQEEFNKYKGMLFDKVKGDIKGGIQKGAAAIMNNPIIKKYHELYTGMFSMFSTGMKGYGKFLLAGPKEKAQMLQDQVKKIKESVGKIGEKITDPIKGIFDKIKKFIGTPKEVDIPKIMKDMFDPNTNKKDTMPKARDLNMVTGKNVSLFGRINNIAKSMLTAMFYPVASVVRGVREFVNNSTKWIGDIGNFLNFGKNTSQGVPENVQPATTTTDSGTDTSATGSGSHVSQLDPRFRGMKFGKSNIGSNGCGPAVAASVLRSYGRNANLKDTADYAMSNGYVAGSSGVGTRASYFSDILGSNGISTSYTNSSNKIKNAVRSGSPTILLGQDSRNSSKANSPFGPNPHYVVARGTDSRGNVYIDDPELNGTALYNKSILNNAKLGVMTGGASEIADPSDYIGKYVRQFESGSKGSRMISKGTGDYGGVSFGTYQFPSYKKAVTTSGKLAEFWNKFYASKFPGVQPGDNQAFKDAWLKAVDSDPTQFFKNEHDTEASEYTAALNRVKSRKPTFDPDRFSRGVQEALWSSAVQYGPGGLIDKVFIQEGLDNNTDKNKALEMIYNAKINGVDNHFKSSSTGVKNGIRSRFKQEFEILKGINNNALVPSVTNGGDGSTGTVSTTGGMAQSGGMQQSTPSSNPFSFSLDTLKEAIGIGITKSLAADSSTGTTTTNADGTTTTTPKSGGVFGGLKNLFGKIMGGKRGFTNTDGNRANNATPGFSNGDPSSTGESGSGDVINNFPYYNQGDPRWGPKAYGPGTFASSACGPTSMAMVLKSYGHNVTPEDTVNYSLANGFRTKSSGTSWGFFNSIGKNYGLNVAEFDPNIPRVKEYLDNNIPVIASMTPGTFTKGGHFIVFSSHNKADDTVTVNDPSHRDLSVKNWNADFALRQAKQFWAVSRPDGTGSIKPKDPSLIKPIATTGATGAGSGVTPIYDFTKKYGNTNYSRHVGRGSELQTGIATLAATNANIDNPALGRIIELLTSIATNTSNNAMLPAIVSILKSCLGVISNMNMNNTTDEEAMNDMNSELYSMMNKLDSLSKAI
jgi:hypothetical protein